MTCCAKTRQRGFSLLEVLVAFSVMALSLGGYYATHLAEKHRLRAVLGLYACTDAERSGPYSERRYTVNRYAEAAERFLGKRPEQLPWGKRVEFPGVMDLVTVEDVIARFDRDCRYLYINPSCLRYAPFSPADLIGRTPQLPPHLRGLAP